MTIEFWYRLANTLVFLGLALEMSHSATGIKAPLLMVFLAVVNICFAMESAAKDTRPRRYTPDYSKGRQHWKGDR